MLGEKISSLRKMRKLSQYELAERLGFSRGKLANYEQGSRQPDYDTLKKIALFFDVTTDYLLEKDGQDITTELPENEKSHDLVAESEDELLKKIKEVAAKHNYQLNDPRFLYVLDIALDIAKRKETEDFS